MTTLIFGQKLPPEHQVLCYCKPSASKPLDIIGKAFALRVGEQGLSLQWLEYFKGQLVQKIIEAERTSRLHYSRNGLLIVFKIDDALNHLGEFYSLEFLYKPSYYDKSHSEMIGLPEYGSLETQQSILLLSDFIQFNANIFTPTET